MGLFSILLYFAPKGNLESADVELLTNWIRGPIMLVLFFFELGEYFIFYIFFSNLVSFSAHVVFSFYSFNVFICLFFLLSTCGQLVEFLDRTAVA